MHVSDSPSGETDKVDAATAATESVTPDANATAGTSAANEGAKPELSLDDVIKASLKPAEAAAEPPTDGKGSEDAESAKVTDASKVEETDEEKEAQEDAKVPFHKHPRWQKRLAENKELKGKLVEFEQEAVPLREKARHLDSIRDFMVNNSLTPEEMTEGMDIMALMKRDPSKALEALRGKVELLEIAVGTRFPKDIQDKVDAGHLDAESAKELTQSRFMAKASEARAEVATETLQQTNVQTQQSGMRSAVVAWETDLKTRDPDYSKKKSFVISRTRELAQQNPPNTPEEAVALAKRAYDDVNKQIRQFAPAKQPVTTVTSDQSSTRSDPAPKSLEDIVRQNIAR